MQEVPKFFTPCMIASAGFSTVGTALTETKPGYNVHTGRYLPLVQLVVWFLTKTSSARVILIVILIETDFQGIRVLHHFPAKMSPIPISPRYPVCIPVPVNPGRFLLLNPGTSRYLCIPDYIQL
jgi:hypothetical protein